MKMVRAIVLAILIGGARPVWAQSGVTPTPDPTTLQQTADQLQAEADAALAHAQVALNTAQAAVTAATQAKVAAAEARQRATALEAQAATEKAVLADQQANEALRLAQAAVESAQAAIDRAEHAVQQLTLAQTENSRLQNGVEQLQRTLREREATIAQQATELISDQHAAEQSASDLRERINDLRSSSVWLGVLGVLLGLLAFGQARQLNRKRSVVTAPATPAGSMTIDQDTTEPVPEPVIAEISPELRAHLDRLLAQAE